MSNKDLKLLIQQIQDNDSSIQNLKLGNQGINGIVAGQLAAALEFNTSVSEIDLGGNDLRDEGARSFARILSSSNRAITALNLSSNRIKDVGAAALLEALKANAAPIMLDIRGNSIYNKQLVEQIQKELAINQKLRQIKLPPLPASRELDLRNFNVSHKSATILPFDGAWHDAISIDFRENPNLKTIPLSLGYLDPLITKKIIFDFSPLHSSSSNSSSSNSSSSNSSSSNSSSPIPDILVHSSLLENTSLLHLLDDTHLLILYCKAKLAFDQQPGAVRSIIAQCYHEATKTLDFKNHPSLDDDTLRRLVVPPDCRQIVLSANPRVTQIPSCFGFLDPQVCTSISFCPSASSPALQPHLLSARTVVTYARSVLKGSLIKLAQVKLVVVGSAAVGKTTLVRALYGQQFDPRIPSTDGIDLGEFMHQGIRFSTWDFGGQRVYRFTHQLFLSDNALYLLVFKLTDPPMRSVKDLRFWLHSITSRARRARVLLVGTHADRAHQISTDFIAATCQRVHAALAAEFPDTIGPLQSSVAPVSPAHGFETHLDTLRQVIHHLAQRAIVEAPENFQEVVSYFQDQSRNPPVIPLYRVIDDLLMTSNEQQQQQQQPTSSSSSHLITAAASIPSTTTLDDIIMILHTLGIIASFPLPRSPSGGLIVTRPQWLASLLSTLITTKHRFINPDTGILSHQTLTQLIWTDELQFPPQFHDDFISILSTLQVIYRYPDPISGLPEYFIPSMLREEPPDLTFVIPRAVLAQSPFHLHRHFVLSTVVPVGVLPPVLINLAASADLKSRWQQGCMAQSRSSPDTWIQVAKVRANVIELQVWGTQLHHVSKLIRLTSSLILERLTEFYHIPYHIIAFCPHCHAPQKGTFHFDDLQGAIIQHQESFHCSSEPPHSLRIDAVAPDLLFADLAASDGFIIPFQSLQEIKVLGQGAFGRVLLMEEKTEERNHLSCPETRTIPPNSAFPTRFAVKILGDIVSIPDQTQTDPMEVFKEFKHEVYIMASLRHPNVIKLVGICLSPFAVVMEVVDGGHLFSQLNDPLHFGSKIMDVALAARDEISIFVQALSNLHQFKYIFTHRERLSHEARSSFHRVVNQVLEPFAPSMKPQQAELLRQNPFAWINHQYQEGIRSEPLQMLHSLSSVSDLGLSQEMINDLLPPLPTFENLAAGKLPQAANGFSLWREALPSPDRQEVVDLETEYFASLRLLYESKLTSESVQRFKAMQNSFNALSLRHLELIAPLDQVLRLKLATDITLGMIQLHSLSPPLVHRDLKTPNIFLTRSLCRITSLDPEVLRSPLAKVGDFGLSLHVSHAAELQVRDRDENDILLNLNPIWAAPELLRGSPYTTAIDVYALGIIFWELWNRQPPFSDVKQEMLKDYICSGHRPLISEMLLQSRPELTQLIQSCWQADPHARPGVVEIYRILYEMCLQYPALVANLPPPSQIAIPNHKSSEILGVTTPLQHAAFPLASPYASLLSLPTVSSTLLSTSTSVPPESPPALSLSSQSEILSSPQTTDIPSSSPSSSSSPLVHTGYLTKKGSGKRRSNWKRRWFLLYPDRLEYFSSERSSRPLGVLTLSEKFQLHTDTEMILAMTNQKKKNKHPHRFLLQVSDRDFHAKASSSAELDQWIVSLRSIASPSPATSPTMALPTPISVPVAPTTPRPSAPPLPPGPVATSLLLPFSTESVWLGFETGHVAMWSEPATGSTPLVYCSNHQQHPGAITSMIGFSTMPEDGSVWSCCSGGQLAVWRSKLSCLEDVLESSITKGYLGVSSKPKTTPSDCWIECENGKLSIFEKRHDVVPRSCVDLIKDLLAVNWDSTKTRLLLDLVPPHRQITLCPSSTQASDDDRNLLLDGWFDALKNIQSAKSERGTLSQVAHRHLSKSALLALLSSDYSVWCCDARFMLSEWTLSNPEDQHGLTRTLALTPMRTIQLLIHESPVSNLNGLCSSLSFHRSAATSLLLVIPGQFVSVDLADLKFYTHPEPKLEGLIGSICIFNDAHQPEIWTAHSGGILRIWSGFSLKPVHLLPTSQLISTELSLPSHVDEISTFFQSTSTELWVATSSGIIYSVDIETKTIQNKPLLCLSDVKILYFQSLRLTSSQSIVWSILSDNSLLRFN